MKPTNPPTAAALLKALAGERLLLVQDPKWPSVAALVAGEVVRGSWWGHPSGQLIFRLLNELEDAGVLFVKLVDEKVTLVDKSLAGAVAAVGSAREPWQTKGLSAAAKKLLADVDARGPQRASGKAAKELEVRLLLHARQVHTESGKHETELGPWPASRIDVDEGKRAIEAVIDEKNRVHETKRVVPWR